MFRAKEYKQVKSLEEAYELNQKKSALVVGGMMWLKMSHNQKSTIIDLSALGLDQIEETEEEFRIGCMCSLRDLEVHQGLDQYFGGLMKESVRHIVGVQFRNGATVGGSIFGRFGFSDVLTAFLALDAYVELYHGGIVPLKEFVQMPYDRDILVRIMIRKDGRRCVYTTQRQSSTDFPLIAVAVSKLEDKFFVSIGARPMRAQLEEVADCENRETMIEELVSRYTFGTNLRGSGEYRKELAKIYVKRLMDQLDADRR